MAPLSLSYSYCVIFLRAVLFLLFSTKTIAFTLDGSPSTFAQFPRWSPGLDGTLSFRFRTREPNALLLYTDGGPTFDFFELKLVEGTTRLRFDLGGGPAFLTAGRNLHDSQWHTLQITRNAEETILKADEDEQRRLTPGPDYNFGNLSTNGPLFFGGLPSWYSSKLNLLALPTVFFEPRFKGSFEDLTFASDDAVHRVQEMQESKGIRSRAGSVNGDEVEEHCEQPKGEEETTEEGPCLNGGKCISTDAGPTCDCRGTDYEGDQCEQRRPPSEASFTGNEYLMFELRGGGKEPLVGGSERLSLRFRTRTPSGLLFLAAGGPRDARAVDFLHIALRGGAVTVASRLGSGPVLEKAVRPSRTRFDDNQWHQVVVHRKVREIARATGFCHLSVTVDGVYTERGTTAGSFSALSTAQLFVGGVDPAMDLLPPSRVRNSFVGCLRKVEYSVDGVALDLVSLAKGKSPLLRHQSSTQQYLCQEAEAQDPITFTTPESFLALPAWEGSRTGTISFKFRTTEGTGLLLYNGGPQASAKGPHADVFALELLEGQVYLVLGLGSGVTRVRATRGRSCDDGSWHSVTLRRGGRTGRIAVDESAFDFTVPGTASQLDLEGPLYVGGLPTWDEGARSPPELWTAHLRRGFVGCLRHLTVNGRSVDLAAHAREQDSGGLRPSCHASSHSSCESSPCLNGGHCAEGWNRFVCDCTRTGFTGPVCAKDASTLSFDGSQFLRIGVAEGASRTQAEDAFLRFRTPRPGGLLFATTTDKPPHTFFAIGLEAGKLKIVIHLGHKNRIIHFGQSLNDNTWHTVHVRRRGHKMDVRIDSESKSYDLGEEESVTLEVRHLHAGAVHPDSERPFKDFFPNFVGHLQHLLFNGRHYLDMVHSSQLADYQLTAKFGKREQIVHHPVTFKSRFTFLGLPQLRAYSSLELYLQFKTREPEGLILYNGGKGLDFVALELSGGHLRLAFDLGDGPRAVRSATASPLNDGRWHAVTVARPSSHLYTLMVDDTVTKVNSPGPNVHLDLHGLLYVGGVRRSMYSSLPSILRSRHGFQGCLASVDLNGDATGDLVRDALIPSTLVSKGCAGPITKCSHTACANHGVCVQMWNSYACDCDMTSFSGPICADESISYEFGPGTGIIRFEYPPDKRPDTKTDLVALGFITMADSGVLVRVDSGSSNDYLEIEIVDGTVLAVYNMGTEDHPIGEHSVQVNDGRYHVIRFTRSGPNSTIQIDDHNVRAKHPSGRQLTVFNSHSSVEVGGKRSKGGPLGGNGIERPFQGIVSGLVVNGDRILDMAAEDDPRVAVEGDVELLMSLPLSLQQRSLTSGDHGHRMLQTGASPAYEGDDLVYSGGGGGGSGCWDDEDDCGEMEPTSSDDLITPVYIPPTPKPHLRTTASPPSVSKPSRPRTGVDDTTCDDEEDCEGSGLGELVFPGAEIPSPAGGEQPAIPPKHDDFGNPSVVTPPPPPPQWGPPSPPIPTTPATSLYRPQPSSMPVTPSETVRGLPTEEREEPIGSPARPPIMRRPPVLMPVTTRMPSGPPSSRAPPSVYGVPIPELPSTGRDRGQRPPGAPRARAPADDTAVVIGVVAGVLVVVVVVALVVYRVRGWAAAGPPGKEPPAPSPGTQYRQAPQQQQAAASALHANGAVKPTSDPKILGKQPATKKKDVKDLKEWYV